MPLAFAHDAARPARYLGHEIGAEALDDLVERPRNGRKRSQIVIECAGRDEFERLFQRLKGS